LAEETRKQFCVDFQGCSIEVIPNFGDTDRFSPDAPSSGVCFDTRRPTAVHVSNFRPVKRVPWLVEAFLEATRGRDAHLVLIGDGPDQLAARERAREGGGDGRVTFLGERDVLPELLAAADVFALSSSSESFGLSALEAMACGTPVVACAAGGVGEVVTHGRTGLLSPVADRAAFARHMGELLFDRPRAEVMGRAARADALERFRRELIVEAYEALYRRMLERP